MGLREQLGGGAAKRRLVVAAVAVMLALSLAAAASAQDIEQLSDPYATGEDLAQDGTLPDTDVTPKPKPTELWRQIAGARFGETQPIRSPSPYDGSDEVSFDVSFYDVAFRNPRLGLAGGASCRDAETGEVPEPGTEQAGECTPVMYQFAKPQSQDPAWRRIELPGQDEAGYVGQIAWIDANTALVVGGDGRYPRRELARPPDQSYGDWVTQDEEEGAGMGRAWLYDAGSWRELDLSRPPADGMRGMSALDCHATLELCVAGALGQLWHWEDGRFTIKADRDSPALFGNVPPGEIPMRNARLFEFRVREVRFMKTEQPSVMAVTAGCCAESAVFNTPRLLIYSEHGGAQWLVRTLGNDSTDYDPAFSVSLDSYSGEGKPLGLGPGLPYRRANRRPHVPDSFYSLIGYGLPAPGSPTRALSVLAAPGGPRLRGEPPSLITQRYCLDDDGRESSGALVDDALAEPVTEAARASLSTARLVAADGDGAKSNPLSPTKTGSTGGLDNGTSASPSTISQNRGRGATCQEAMNRMPGDAIPDWSVGELGSNRVQGLGRQGLAVATHLRPYVETEVLNAELERFDSGFPAGVRRPTPAEILGGYEATSQDKLSGYLAARHFVLSSYSINALDMDDQAGVGWAVGDHGAILNLAGARSGEGTGVERRAV